MTPGRKRLLIIGLSAMAGILALNCVAYRHALAMTRYGPSSLTRTGKPDQLGWGERAKVLVLGVSVPRPVARRTPADLGLAFETLTLASRDGTTLEGWRVPLDKSRGVAVLLHGYAAEKSAMLPEAAALREFGYESLLVDFRGSGGSEGDDTTVGWLEAEDAVAAIELARKLAPGKPVLVYAKSMGAASALRAAGVLGAAPDAMALESAFDTLVRTTQRRFKLMRLPPWPFTGLLLYWGGRRAGFSPDEHAPMAYASGVDCPTLLLQGARDKYVKVEDAERILANLRKGRLVIFEESGHGEFSRNAPEVWRREMADFLKAL